MSDFLKTFQEFINSAAFNRGRVLLPRPTPKSSGYITPGNIYTFTYNGKPQMVLVVANKRSTSGVFLSSKNNMLLSSFTLLSKMPETINLVIDNLYKNRKAASYSGIKQNLSKVLGKTSYRTFNLNKISHLQAVLIK